MKKKKLFIALGLLAATFTITACDNTSAGDTTTNNTIPTTAESNTNTDTNTSKDNNNITTNDNTGETPNTNTGESQTNTNTTDTTSDNTGGNQNNKEDDTPKEDVKIEGAIEVKTAAADQESLYAEFYQKDDVTTYNAYVKGENGDFTKLDNQLIRYYKGTDKNYYRVDAVGLKAGNYTLKLVAVKNNEEISATATEIKNLAVEAYDRTGFAFSKSSPNAGSAPGAYNNDGTLKSNADVIYLTEDNKKTVTLNIGGTEYTGISNITQAFKTKNGAKPLAIRVIGKVTFSDISCSDMSKWYCMGIKGGNDLTIEGIGNDATLYGFGVGCNDSSSIEFRNLGFIEWGLYNADADAIQMQGSKNVWVHDNDIFYGHKQSGDQAKGDGSCDLKDDSMFVTIAYNHFFDSGKMSLCGMKSESGENYISYHHNWFDHSDSRHPRIRTMTVHVYNNYYDGISKYGIGAVKGAQCFAEGNYFRNCKYPFLIGGYGSDATFDKTIFSGETQGFIKAFNNTIEGATKLCYCNASAGTSGSTYEGSATSSDAYLALTRSEVVSSDYKNGVSYSNFDTNGSVDLGVTADQIETPENAKNTTIAKAGRIQGGDFKYTFDNATADASYEIDTVLADKLINYKSNLISVQGIESSSSQTEEPDTPVVSDKTAEDVIALIEALPASTDVTEADRTAINAAKAAYDALDTAEQAKVTNKDKLDACISALPVKAFVKTFNDGVADKDGFFTISGNLNSKGGSVTYNGTTYTTSLKMESSTSISFTCTTSVTLTIVTDTASKKIKVNGNNNITNADKILTITLEAGTHTIIKGDSMNVYAIIVE